jgi:hypothetical protein
MIVNNVDSNKTKPAFGRGSEIFHELKAHVLTKGSEEIPKVLMDKAFRALMEAKKAKGEEISSDKFAKVQKDLHVFMKSKAKAIEEIHKAPVDMRYIYMDRVHDNPFDPVHKSFDRLFGEQTLKLQAESPKTASAKAVSAASNAVKSSLDISTSRSLFNKLKMHVSINGVNKLPKGVMNEAFQAFVDAKKAKGEPVAPEKLERAKKDVNFFMSKHAYDIHDMLQNPKALKSTSFDSMQKSFDKMFGLKITQKATTIAGRAEENLQRYPDKSPGFLSLITKKVINATSGRKFGEQTIARSSMDSAPPLPIPPAIKGKVQASFKTSPHINDGEPVFNLVRRKLSRPLPPNHKVTVDANSGEPVFPLIKRKIVRLLPDAFFMPEKLSVANEDSNNAVKQIIEKKKAESSHWYLFPTERQKKAVNA